MCTNCGHVDCYELIQEFCSFHGNNYKIMVWSIYLRKYYLNKVIFNVTKKYDTIVTTKNKSEIIVVFEKINNVLAQVNDNRQWLINMNFIMIIYDIQINIDYLKIIKWKKILSYYHNYWNNILKLISNDYNIIPNK